MADYLVRRGSFWRFVRRVPKEYEALDPRGIVQQSTKIRIADDPRAIRARKVALGYNAALEAYWHDLVNTDSAQAVRDYEAARAAARRLGISPPIDSASARTLADILSRIERLMDKAGAADDRATLKAVYDAAPKPGITFRQCAERFIEAHEPSWSNAKHAKQWKATLETYAYPVISNVPVAQIGGNGNGAHGTDLILKILEPIWHPARWRGHLDKLLPARSKVAPVKHHAALPYIDLPAFMRKLRQQPGTVARALEFAVLTAGRASEILGAKRSEIDREARMWTVPAERMKARRAHRVPLCDGALAIVDAAPPGEYLFPGKRGEPLNGSTMFYLLDRMGMRDQITTHGFRSTFRDWASETTNYPNEMLEMAIAHTIGDKAEAAYRRGDLLAKRHALMAEWQQF